MHFFSIPEIFSREYELDTEFAKVFFREICDKSVQMRKFLSKISRFFFTRNLMPAKVSALKV